MVRLIKAATGIFLGARDVTVIHALRIYCCTLVAWSAQKVSFELCSLDVAVGASEAWTSC